MSKPTCPLCGRKLQTLKEHDEGGWSAYCDHCTLVAGHFDTKKELKKAFSKKPDEPLGCPLCGRPAFTHSSSFNGKRYYTISCRHCFLDVGGIEGRQEAIRTWNRRRG